MNQHTPGPWHVYRGELCYRSQEDDQSFGMSCPVRLSDPANEALVTAAPKMLEALKDALCSLEISQQSDYVTARVRAAIDAGEGRST